MERNWETELSVDVNMTFTLRREPFRKNPLRKNCLMSFLPIFLLIILKQHYITSNFIFYFTIFMTTFN